MARRPVARSGALPSDPLEAQRFLQDRLTRRDPSLARQNVLGPNTRMVAQGYSNPENTYIDPRQGTGYSISGLYVPNFFAPRDLDRAEYVRDPVFPSGPESAPGQLYAVDDPSTISHELLHRMQDVRPVKADLEFNEEMREIFADMGVPEDLIPQDFSRLLTLHTMQRGQDNFDAEIFPHMATRGFARTPLRFLEAYGIDGEALNERVSERGDSYNLEIQERASQALERLIQRTMTSAEVEQAETAMEPRILPNQMARYGRATYR